MNHIVSNGGRVFVSKLYVKYEALLYFIEMPASLEHEVLDSEHAQRAQQFTFENFGTLRQIVVSAIIAPHDVVFDSRFVRLLNYLRCNLVS